MMTRLAASGLPLLAKELIEQAARRRTYIVRSAYAFLLFMFVTLIFWGEVYDRSSSPFDLLGQGRTMFQIVLMLQTAGVLLFTPALTCGAITIEKERNTFGLLLLTRLSPSTILLEKYLGRLVMMGTFLLLSLPLLGLCYTIGGVTQLDLWSGFAALVITVMQLSAVGLCCSAYFRTTTGAFFGAYIFGFLLLFGPAMTLFIDDDFVEWMADGEAQLVEYAVELCVAVGWYAINAWDQLLGLDSFAVDFRQNQALVSQPLSYGEEDGAFLFFAVPRMMVIERFWTAPPTWQVAVRGLPALMSIPSILLLARFFMVRRAFVGPSNYLLSFFRRLDSVFHRMNQNRWTKGIVLVNDTQSLPKENPVAWRETTKRTLGTVRYLVRVFVALEFPILMFCLIVLTVTAHRSSDRNGAITFVIIIAWLAAILLVTVKAATLVAGERSHETLDVLLSTPIRSADLIRQKFQGVTRVAIVSMIPLLTALFTQGWYTMIDRGLFHGPPDNWAALYLLVSVLSVGVYIPLIAWLGFYVGLRMKSQTRAIFTSLAILCGWILIPFVLVAVFLEITDLRMESPAGFLLLLSPAAVPFFAEVNELEIGDAPFLATVVNFLGYGAIVVLLRWHCLKHAAGFLGRAERSDAPTEPPHTPQGLPPLSVKSQNAGRMEVSELSKSGSPS